MKWIPLILAALTLGCQGGTYISGPANTTYKPIAAKFMYQEGRAEPCQIILSLRDGSYIVFKEESMTNCNRILEKGIFPEDRPEK